MKKLVMVAATLGVAALCFAAGPSFAAERHTYSSRSQEKLGYAATDGDLRRFFFTSPRKRAVARKNAAPLSFQLFCLKSPADCKSGGSRSVHLSSENLAKLQRVNRTVNRSIRPRNDGRVDQWTADAKSGDCEDFALTKRRALLRAGLPPSALRIAVTRTRRGEGHAVLIVRTSSGDRILDNRTNAIRTWNQSDLSLVKISGANPLVWN